MKDRKISNRLLRLPCPRLQVIIAKLLPAIAFFILDVFFPLPSLAVSPTIVISQVYGAGGNSGATLRNDFIELFNRGTTNASVSGWSVQYAATAGTSWQKTDLTNVTLAPGQYYLVQEAGGANGSPLPAADATGVIPMAAGAG